MTSTLTVATLNIGDGPTKAKLTDLNALVAAGTHAILGQEFGDRLDLVLMFLRVHPGWSVVWNRRRNKTREVPILYDTRVLRLTWWSQVLVHIGYLGPKGAGGNDPGIKAVTRARFRHLPSGRRVRLVDVHTIASAFSTRGSEHLRRVAAYTRQVRAFFGSLVGCTIGGGDFNAERTNPVVHRLTPRRWCWDSHGDTRGRRSIDLIGHTRCRWLLPVRSGTLSTDGSRRYGDHKAVLVSCRIRPRRPAR